MRKVWFFMLSLFILQMSNCKSDSDILATYSGGSITRGELYKWLDARRIPRDSVIKKKMNQKLKLKQMATDKLVYNVAVKAGFDSSRDMGELLEILKWNFLSGFYVKKIRNEGDFREKSARVRIIKLTEKNFKMEDNKKIILKGRELESEAKKESDLARSIIDRLNRNESFEKLAGEYSEDPSKKEGGDIGYITEGMREPQIVNAALSLNPGQYTKDPVRINNALYILKVEDKKELTGSNIDSVIGDKAKAERLKKRLQFNRGKSIENSLMNTPDVHDYTDKAQFRSRDEVLFKIGTDSFTSVQLDRFIELTNKRNADSGQNIEKLDTPRKKQFAKRILSQKLLYREALKAGADKDQEFLKDWEVIRENSISNEYKNEIALKDIKITEKEIREEYDKNKDRAYKRKVKKGGNNVEEVIPYGEVKERISSMLMSRNKSLSRRKWEDDLLNRSEFKVNENKLEGD